MVLQTRRVNIQFNTNRSTLSSSNIQVSNRITTAKYGLATFFPKFVYEQFRRYSNIFFSIIALFQQIPGVSPTGRYTTAVPLLCILGVSAIKELFEDMKRHKADRKINESEIFVLDKDKLSWNLVKWQDVKVGDIVKCISENFFPSDILLLSSSGPNGMCYIETANLDGETNLKIRQSLPCTSICVTGEKLRDTLNYATIECDSPNPKLYEFEGRLMMPNDVGAYPLGPENILLRGAKLRNTNWCSGVVLYTGHESKLMMNSLSEAPIKQSRLEKITNTQILWLVFILLTTGFLSAVLSQIWTSGNAHEYLFAGSNLSYVSFPMTFLTFVILYNNLVPISLQVSLEVVRTFQAHFINCDLEMYDKESNSFAMARTSNLNEELGLVRYILSDKTGTLTKNVMNFKKCSINGQMYDDSTFDILATEAKEATTNTIREFLRLLSVCHTVVPETRAGERIYHAASPDEGALVRGAQRIGYEFSNRTPDQVFVTIFGKEEGYNLLHVFEFDSFRKRMSVVVRGPDNVIKIYTKGADNVIYERLSSDNLTEVTSQHLERFAHDGFRTLCCAYAEIDGSRYEQWLVKFNEVNLLFGDDKIKGISDCYENLERDLILLGATAIEDKLQDEVPETIDTLLRAGINFWLLTGDKQETAINIGFSSKLLSRRMPIIILNEDSFESTKEFLQKTSPNSESALVVDGKSLQFALSGELRNKFMKVALECKSVICCRVSPFQKATIVQLVKDLTNEVTLAIGDGANDVAMIRTANIGVGISGTEGLQAAHSADYTISQFRFLARLLLVHGFWSMSRLRQMILYSFYKNIALYVVEFWFAIVSGWSGQTIFERWTIALYNVIFTAAPPFAMGVFDRKCPAETMLKYPQLYKGHSNHRITSNRSFWMWIGTAFWHSLLLFWFTYFIISHDTLWASGKSDGGYLVFGNILYTYVVVTVCLKAGLEMTSWTILTHFAIWGSIASWFFFLIIYSRLWPLIPIAADMVGIDTLVFGTRLFWLGLALVPITALIADVIYKVYVGQKDRLPSRCINLLWD